MTPYYHDAWLTVYAGDCRAVMAEMPERSVHCVVTSPPYWGLRDYGTATWVGGDEVCDHVLGMARGDTERETPGGRGGSFRGGTVQFRNVCGKCHAVRVDGQIGLEPTPEQYVETMVAVFREVRRVLRDDGTVWLNLGDSYASGEVGRHDNGSLPSSGPAMTGLQKPRGERRVAQRTGLKPKDLVGIPWMVAKALQAPYYVGRIKSEPDRAWLAGFLDGEGTISFVERNRGEDHTPTHDARVFITNTDREPLDYFAALTAGHVYEHDGERVGRFGSKPCYRWQMGTHDAALLLRELYPYLRTKRRQAALIWTLYTTLRHKNGHARTPESIVARRREIAAMVRSLNSGGDVVLPAWVEEPPAATEDGWYLRSDIVWSKPNPMPESVTDRPTKSHEYVFLLSKRERYYFDADAVRQGFAETTLREYGDGRLTVKTAKHKTEYGHGGLTDAVPNPAGRNLRSVWTIATQPYPGAHFATFPEALVEPCVKAGSPVDGVVLDCFAGSGTTGRVAQRLGRRAILIDLNPTYLIQAMVRNRDIPLGLGFGPTEDAA